MIHVTGPCAPLGQSNRVAFGRFDGLHRGHNAVIRALCDGNGPAVLLSLDAGQEPSFLSEEEKAILLRSSGVELMVSLPASKIEALSAEAFVREILVGSLHASCVVVGENVRFGCDGKGLQFLRDLGSQLGFAVEAIPVCTESGVPVSGELLLDAISAGDFARFSSLLGHVYTMHGTVVHGKAAGRRHGMPTVNLGLSGRKILPPHGVYGTLAYVDGQVWKGVTNVGLRPSADNFPTPTVETFLLDFDRDVYDHPITLEFYTYIRGVMKFPGGLDDVRRQIDRDIASVRSQLEQIAEAITESSD